MLSKQLAASCGVSEGELIQMRCNYCHRRDLSTEGMDDINLAKNCSRGESVSSAIPWKGKADIPRLT